MICPNCHTQIELTWKRYITSPLSRFICAACSTKFKLKRPFYYWFLPLALYIGILGGGIVLINYSAYGTFALIILTIILSILFLAIDKNWENNLETIEIKEGSSGDESLP